MRDDYSTSELLCSSLKIGDFYVLTELLYSKNKGINLHGGVFSNFNTSKGWEGWKQS